MKILQKKLDFRGKKYGRLLAGGCWHNGQPNISDKGIYNFLERGKKFQYIHHGDIIEAITPKDRRYEADSHATTLTKQCEASAEQLKDTRCEGLILGNHEATPSGEFGDLSAMIANWADVPYLSACAYITWECEKGSFLHFVCHGNGSANFRSGEPERRKINKKLKLRQILDPFQADLKGMAHMHTAISIAPCYEKKLGIVNGELDRHPVKVRDGWAYATASMFKTYDEKTGKSNYGELKIYPATDIGWTEIIVRKNGDIDRILECNENGEVIEETTPITI